ncbi:MAG: hypothetical protein WD342_08095 [Verrucomicrobiales bacterium]
MKSRYEDETNRSERICRESFEMVFPEPDEPLLEGPGEPCTWLEFMRETAVQTNHWLKHFDNEPPPPAWEEKFTLD